MMNNRGYILMELLLSLALVSILTSLISFSVKNLSKHHEEIELKQLVGDLNYLRNKSNQANDKYYIQLDFKTNSYSLVDANNGKARVRSLTSGLKILSSNFEQSRITFINGGISKGGTIVLDSSRGKIELAIPPVYPRVNIKYEK